MILYDGAVSVWFDENNEGEEPIFSINIPFKYLSVLAGSKVLQVQVTGETLDHLDGGILGRARGGGEAELTWLQEAEYERATSERDALEELEEEQ